MRYAYRIRYKITTKRRIPRNYLLLIPWETPLLSLRILLGSAEFLSYGINPLFSLENVPFCTYSWGALALFARALSLFELVYLYSYCYSYVGVWFPGCFSTLKGVAIFHYTRHSNFSAPSDIARRVIRCDWRADSCLMRPPPPKCCDETQFFKKLCG